MKHYMPGTEPQQPMYFALINWKKVIIFCILLLTLISCSEFVEIDPPKNTLISENVFENAATVKSAMANVYYKLREEGMASYAISASLGIYSDELDYYYSDPDYVSIYQHNIMPLNEIVSNIWRNSYSLLYAVNDIIEGVDKSTGLTTEEKKTFKGQALFMRGYLHSLLVNLYGDIPYITSTDYETNNTIGRTNVDDVYNQIITDLTLAVSLMDKTDFTGQKVIPTKSAAEALLARMYLYTGNWELAEVTSAHLIEIFDLELDVNKVFLKESQETIWQLKSDEIYERNTYEANQFVITAIPGNDFALSNTLLDSFEADDLRLQNWIGSFISNDGLTKLFFPYKYKATLSETESLEYSIVFRVAEQYLIRAEARAQLGKIVGSQQDINAIRLRAGLNRTMAASKEELLTAILHERQVELFTEQGHRWGDIKRMGKAETALASIKPNWKPTDVRWPIPENEITINKNLKPQNPGY